MSIESPFEVEDRGVITILKVLPPPRGLVLTNHENMRRFWSILNNVAFKKQRVLLIVMGDDGLAPKRVDEAWEDIRRAAISSKRLPPEILAVHANMKKLIDYFQTSRTLAISAFSGAVDIDLFGLLALTHYRICTTTSTFENNTIDRAAPPGSATVWSLARLVGSAQAGNMLLESKSLTASEALDLNLVNAVVPPDELQSFAEQKAEYFASKPQVGLSTLVIAMNNAHKNLPEYLDSVGTGYDAIFAEE